VQANVCRRSNIVLLTFETDAAADDDDDEHNAEISSAAELLCRMDVKNATVSRYSRDM